MDTQAFLQQCQQSNPNQVKNITILGAGIAGLVAAYELEKLGHNVEILEGSPRVGGRVMTHRFGKQANSPYAELGAMRIPSSHNHTLHYVNEMGLGDKLRKFVTVFEEQNALMSMSGQVIRIKDAPQLLQQRYQDLFDAKYSQTTRLFASWLKTIIDTIAPNQLREEFDRDLQSHLLDELERLDLQPYFIEGGEGIDINSFIKLNPGFRARCSKGVDMFLSDILVETSHDLLQIEGGTEQLTQRLAQSIKAPIQLNAKIVGIRVLNNQTEITWKQNDEIKTKVCDYVICTIPFSILRKMELVGFDSRKLDAIQNITYAPATKVAFNTKESFWSQQGIKGGASFSGEGVRQTYYPSVDFKSNEGSTLLASYTIGDDAEFIGAMNEEQRGTYVQKVVSKIHPELGQPGMIKQVASIAWGNYEWSQGGCTVHWGGNTGDDSNHRQINYLEAQRPLNTLFFAGEHCSKYPAWLQGSIESALEAIRDIVVHNQQRANVYTLSGKNVVAKFSTVAAA
jgi:monoamine oxidase